MAEPRQDSIEIGSEAHYWPNADQITYQGKLFVAAPSDTEKTDIGPELPVFHIRADAIGIYGVVDGWITTLDDVDMPIQAGGPSDWRRLKIMKALLEIAVEQVDVALANGYQR